MKKIGLYLAMLFVLASFDHLQERTVSGKVTSADNGSPLPGVNILLKGTSTGTVTDHNGEYSLKVPSTGGTLVFSFIGFTTQEIRVGKQSVVNVQLSTDATTLQETVVSGYSNGRNRKGMRVEAESVPYETPARVMHDHMPDAFNTEDYEGIEENIFHGALKKPLSTFSIDVDAASYSNLRRFIGNGQKPPRDAIRVEEMINYFDYDYQPPSGNEPFSVYTEIAQAPWNNQHLLVHIGLQGKIIPTGDLPPSNLVFLIDVSGSMDHPNKLPLVKKSFKLLVDQLRAQDHVAIVVYAGAAGTVLEPTSGDNKKKILSAIDRLHAGGSTAGGAGLHLAYDLAKEHFKDGGNNRVILATDGDFNVGESSNKAMEELIEARRRAGVFLTVLGYGMGNLKDSKMEILADKGNGNYAYIDNLTEARKVLVSEFGGTLFTIAKDVKLQVEFNPARVQAYRLIGYENRKLNDEDFNNDRKDAGDLGSGHTVTALYEIIPAGGKSDFYSIDQLKYQHGPGTSTVAENSDDWLTIKLRYKRPDGDKSHLLVHTLSGKAVALNKSGSDFRWSASVAAFGMLLTESQYINDWTCDDVISLAEGARGEDSEGYRIEFVNMIKNYRLVTAP